MEEDITMEEEIHILRYSSLIFLTNVFFGIWYNLYLYAFLFLLLTFSSVMVHTEDTLFINIVDKIIIFLIFLYGLIRLYYNNYNYNYKLLFLIVLTFLFCIVVYIYGFFNKCFCFDECDNVAQCFHASMHLIGSFGHLLLLI